MLLNIMKKEWLDYFNEPYIVLSVKEVLFDDSCKPIQFKVKNINTFSFKNSPESSILHENKVKYNSNYSFLTNSNRKNNTSTDRIDKEEKANLELLLFSQDYVNTIFNKIEKKFGLKIGFFSTRSDGSYNDNENNDAIEIYNNYGLNIINRSNSARGDVCADFVDKILNNVELNKDISDNHNIENATFSNIKEEFKKTKNINVSNISIPSNKDKSIKVIENDAVYDTNTNQKQNKIRNNEEDLLIDLPKQITNFNGINKNINTQKSSLSSFKQELRKQQNTIPITTHISNTNTNNVVNNNKNTGKERLNNEEYRNLINENRNSYLNNEFEINNINSVNSSYRSKRKRNTINFNQEDNKEVNDLMYKANVESNGKKGKNPDNDIENYNEDDYNIYEDIKFHTSEDVERNNISSNSNSNKTANIKTLFKIKDFDEKIKKINNLNNQEDREGQKKIYKKNPIPNKSNTTNNVKFKNTISNNMIDNCSNAVNKSSVVTIKSPITKISFNKTNINNENNNNSSNSEIANNNLINNNSSDSNKQPYEKQFSNTLRESNIKIRINLEKTNLEQERSLKLRLESKLENTESEFDQNNNNTNTNQFSISIKENNNNEYNVNNDNNKDLMQNNNKKNLVIIKKRIPRNSPNTPPAKSGKHEWNYNDENNINNKNTSCNGNLKSINIPLQKPKSKVSKYNDNVIKSKEIEVIINSSNNNINKTEKENINYTNLTNDMLEKKLHSFQNQNSVIKEENKRLLEVLEFIKQMHNIESNTLDEFLNNMSENKINDLNIKATSKSDNQTDIAVYSKKQNANRINSVSISNNLTNSKNHIENKIDNTEFNEAPVKGNKKNNKETDDDLSKINSNSNKVLEYSNNQSDNENINYIDNKITKNCNTKRLNQLSPIKGSIRNTYKNISFNGNEHFNSKNKDIALSNLYMDDNNTYNASNINTYRTNLFDESLSPRKIFKELDRCYTEEKNDYSNNNDNIIKENKGKKDDLDINLNNDIKNKNTSDSLYDSDKKENALSDTAIKTVKSNNLKNAFIKAKSTVNKNEYVDNNNSKVNEAIIIKQQPSVKFINNDMDINNKKLNVFSNYDNYSFGLNIPQYNKYINTNTEKYKEEYLSKYTKLHKYKRELEEKTKKNTINVQLYTRKEKDNIQKKVIIGKLNANVGFNKAKKFKNLIDTKSDSNIIKKNSGYITFNNNNINSEINNNHINNTNKEKFEGSKIKKEDFNKDSANTNNNYGFKNSFVNKNDDNLDNFSPHNDKNINNDNDTENNSEDDFFNDKIAI